MADLSYLPVIRAITTADGSSLSPADELRIGEGLDVAYVPGPGADGEGGYISLKATTGPAVLPPALTYFFQGIAAGSTKGFPILWASTTAPTFITRIDFIPSDDLTHNDSNYAKITVVIFDAAGNPIGGPIAQWTTQSYDASTRPLGAGDWTAIAVLKTILLGYTIPANSSIWWLAEAGGSGQALPLATWRVTT